MKIQSYIIFRGSLSDIKDNKQLISTINAHSYNIARSDKEFDEALHNSDVLIPDGISIVWAVQLLTREKIKKIAGADLFFYEMDRIAKRNGKVFFLGSNNTTLEKIKKRAVEAFPNVEVHTYSPPYKSEFTEQDNHEMISAINIVQPEVLFIGMTAPKQEKWAYMHLDRLNVGHICCIGAVFDFYAGTIKRAPKWMIRLGLEWFYRLIKEPKRMWRRYVIGNVKFIWYVFKEKINW